MKELNDKEVATRLIQIYFKEIARLGFKRSLTLDEVVNAYYYALSRLEHKKPEMKKALKKVVKEEREIRTETKEELIPTVTENVTTTEKKETRF